MKSWNQPSKGTITAWLCSASIVFVVLVAIGERSMCRACGIEWQRPAGHFDGVDEQGHVSYSEQIDTLNLGDELDLPLFITFNSAREASSPYLGKGWNLCLLESRMEQVDENTFKLVQPDGWYRMFGRGSSGDTVLGGQGNWKAEIKGETITAYADCGWKLVFKQGKIASLTTPKGRQLDWVYEEGRVSELSEGGIARLRVERDANSEIKALALGEGKRILLNQSNKPRVQSAKGQNLVVGSERSLGELTFADGKKQSFAYGIDERSRPTIEVSTVDSNASEAQKDSGVGVVNIRKFSWDPQSKLIIGDGKWAYQITQAVDSGANAAVSRTDDQGKLEYWFYDGARGEETTVKPDGTRVVRTWFVGGKLNGKTRKIEEAQGRLGNAARRTIFSYDLDGNMRRCLLSDGTALYFAVRK